MHKIEQTRKQNLKGLISVYDEFALFHPTTKKGIGVGRPIKASSLKNIFKFLNGNTDYSSYKFKGIISENVLNYNSDSGDITFYTKPQRRKMIFQSNLKIENTEYNIPYLLWNYSNHSLKIFALKSKPKENDFLYSAPFLNVSYNGLVCMGNVRFKNNTGEFNAFIDILQDLFFNSLFTHTNNNELASCSIQEAYEMAKSIDFKWDKYLVKTKKKVIDIL